MHIQSTPNVLHKASNYFLFTSFWIVVSRCTKYIDNGTFPQLIGSPNSELISGVWDQVKHFHLSLYDKIYTLLIY